MESLSDFPMKYLAPEEVSAFPVSIALAGCEWMDSPLQRLFPIPSVIPLFQAK